MLFKLSRIGVTDWDEYEGFVVRASDEYQARQLASHADISDRNSGHKSVWTNPGKSTCEQLDPNASSEVILDSFMAG